MFHWRDVQNGHLSQATPPAICFIKGNKLYLTYYLLFHALFMTTCVKRGVGVRGYYSAGPGWCTPAAPLARRTLGAGVNCAAHLWHNVLPVAREQWSCYLPLPEILAGSRAAARLLCRWKVCSFKSYHTTYLCPEDLCIQ